MRRSDFARQMDEKSGGDWGPKEVKNLITMSVVVSIYRLYLPPRGNCTTPELSHRSAAFKSVSLNLTTQAHNPINCHAASTKRLLLNSHGNVLSHQDHTLVPPCNLQRQYYRQQSSKYHAPYAIVLLRVPFPCRPLTV